MHFVAEAQTPLVLLAGVDRSAAQCSSVPGVLLSLGRQAVQFSAYTRAGPLFVLGAIESD